MSKLTNHHHNEKVKDQLFYNGIAANSSQKLIPIFELSNKNDHADVVKDNMQSKNHKIEEISGKLSAISAEEIQLQKNNESKEMQPPMYIIVFEFLLVISIWAIATILLTINGSADGFNVTTTIGGLGLGQFFGILTSTLVTADTTIKTFIIKKPKKFNWLFVGLFFQPCGSAFAWFLWCNLSGTPNTDMTILSAMLPLQLLIPIGHGVCYLNEKLNGVKIFGICVMILSAVMLSCDITSLISGTNNDDTNNQEKVMPAFSIFMFASALTIWGINYTSIGAYRKSHTTKEYQCTFNSGCTFNLFVTIIVIIYNLKTFNCFSISFVYTATGSYVLVWANNIYSHCSKYVPSYISVSASTMFLIPTTLAFMVIYDKIFSVFHYIGFFGMILSATLVIYNKQKKKQKKKNIVTAAENKKKPEEDEINIRVNITNTNTHFVNITQPPKRKKDFDFKTTS